MAIKLNDKWKSLFTSEDNYFVVTGGRGSGKSFAISYFSLFLISSSPGHRIAVYRATMVSAKDSIMQDMKDLVPKFPNADEFQVMDTKIRNKRTGSEIFFKGIQTSRKDYTAALKGLSNCTTFILDEAEELTEEELWDKIDDTFRTKVHQLRMFVLLNPTTREHWIYDRFFVKNQWNEGTCGSKNGITYIHTTYLDNTDNIEESKLAKWHDAKISRPEYYKHTILGGWRDAAEGVIFDLHYGDEDTQPAGTWMIGKFEKVGKSIWGLDFGSNDPSVLVEASANHKHKKLYVRTHFFMPGMVEDDILERASNVAGNQLIVADSAAKMHIEGLRRKGLNIVSAKKGPDSVMKGIDILKEYKIVVDENSLSIIREFRNYKWDEKKDYPNDKEGFDHGIDALRYCMYFELAAKYSKAKNTIF